MDNIDISINDTSAVTESIIEELEKLAEKNDTSLEYEIAKYNKEEGEEILERFNISGCMNYEWIIEKFDDSDRRIEELVLICCGEDLSCILEYALKYGCKVTEIELHEESENILFGSFNHEAKFKITLQYKYGEI